MKKVSTPRFEIFKSKKNGQFYFRFVAKNGKVVCQSEGYKRIPGCQKGIKSLKLNAFVSRVVDLTKEAK